MKKLGEQNKTSRNKKSLRKAAQLCAQIRRALEFIVPDALASSAFDVIVMDVQPAPNTGHFLVLLAPTSPLDNIDQQELEQELLHRSGVIRTAIAQSIRRRKVPTITFRIMPQ